jgi:hypothetical protein
MDFFFLLFVILFFPNLDYPTKKKKKKKLGNPLACR